MHLNVRHRPLRSRLLVNPFSFLSHRNSPEEPAAESRRSPSPDRRPKTRHVSSDPSDPSHLQPKRRTHLSSRVDHAFRESYERFRAAFERKREEREQYAAAQTFLGWKLWPWNWFRSRATASPPTWRGHSPSNSALSPVAERQIRTAPRALLPHPGGQALCPLRLGVGKEMLEAIEGGTPSGRCAVSAIA